MKKQTLRENKTKQTPYMKVKKGFLWNHWRRNKEELQQRTRLHGKKILQLLR